MEKKLTYGVWAVRSSTSIFGPAQSWCKENGKPLEFDSKADAENYAKEANEHTTANVRYYVKEKEPEPGAVRKGTSQPELDARSHEEVTPRNDACKTGKVWNNSVPWRNHTQRAVSFICECMDRQPAGAVSFITAASEKAIPSLLGMYGWFCTFRGNQFTRSNPRGKRRIRNTAYSRK